MRRIAVCFLVLLLLVSLIGCKSKEERELEEARGSGRSNGEDRRTGTGRV